MKLNTRFTAIATAALTIAAFTFTACRKDKNTDEDTGYGSEHALLEKSFSDAQSIADQAGTSGSLSTFKNGATILSGCATVTNDTLAIPHVLTIDFGPVNCLCADGVNRRGKIIVTYSGHYRDLGHTHVITFDSYYQNDNAVSGTKTVAYNANNAQGQPVYNISVSGSIVRANNGGTISWTSTRTRTWTAGFSTGAWGDDEYDIAGTGTITRANGKTFTISTTTPLHMALACRFVESGIVEITPQGGSVRTLDYGNGTCDADAVFTVNGTAHNITLR